MMSFTSCASPTHASAVSFAETPPPEELGDVHWLRDFAEATQRSEKSGKPIFILFQEVPGCANCTRYGKEILSNPLMVEAIEDLFVPLAIFNNQGGADAEVLKRYGEPAWNNPVVRIVDAKGKDLVARMPDFRSAAQLSAGMIKALECSNKIAPPYLRLLHEAQTGQELPAETATFHTACFWSGEAFFGAQDGVTATEAGWQNGREVVRVQYNASSISLRSLKSAADNHQYVQVDNGKFKLDREPKYYLLKSKYAAISMPELQASRVNAMLGQGRNPDRLLSPRQLAQLQRG